MARWQIDTGKIANYLGHMVSIDSINPDLVPGGAGEGKIADWLLDTCWSLGLDAHLQETAPHRPNVIARWKGSGNGKSLLLTGHTDVVGIENMTIEPFKPVIENGRLYGRGSFDMKGGLAAILGAIVALKAANFQPAGDLILGFVTDEEYYSIGTDALVKEVKADAAILTEPSDMGVCIAHRGFAWLTITVEGLAAHGSLYDEGVDAIRNMRHVLDVIDLMEREILPQKTHPILGRASVHASVIDGGLGWSTYPDRCTLKVEHRLLPGETGKDVMQLWQTSLQQIQANQPDFKAQVALDFERPAFETTPDSPIVQTLDSAYQTVTGKAPEHTGMLAWLDSALLSAAGIPTVILGPGGDGAHAAVEYVNLEEVVTCAAIIAETAARWVGEATA